MKTTSPTLPLVRLIVALAASSGSAATAAEFTTQQKEDRVIVWIDGDLFTEYLTRSERQPVLWPVIGPTGKRMTRAFPIDERGPHERDDHKHHRSIWFTHGDVNGADFWHSADCIIAHREFVRVEGGPDQAVVVARNDWLDRGSKVCEDLRTLAFGAGNGTRWIDFTIEITAVADEVAFGDTKEGTFAVRVAGTMKVDADMGGRIVNSHGQVDKDAWGQPAEWVDYYGPVDGETVGVAILSHPDSFRHPCRWHVRTYGLFAANPFGHKAFPKSDHQQGVVRLKKGESRKLRYRIVLHAGTTDEARIADAYARFTARDVEQQ